MLTLNKLTPSNTKEFLDANKDSFLVLLFDAQFTEQEDILEEAKKALTECVEFEGKIVIGTVDVEENNDLATKFSIQSVPIVVCVNKGKTVRKIDTLNTSKLVTCVKEELRKHSLLSSADETLEQKTDPKEKFEEYLKKLVSRAPVMIFMKGNPQQPRCGFSKQLIELLSKYSSIKYDTFDILLDEEVRQGLKTFSDWPTYPQIYAKGEFVGGLDILKQLDETNELESTLKA